MAPREPPDLRIALDHHDCGLVADCTAFELFLVAVGYLQTQSACVMAPFPGMLLL